MRLLPALLIALGGWLEPGALAAADLGEPYFESVAGTESFANGIVTALAQDGRGLIWLGTTEGLLQFDGYRLRQYRNAPDDPRSLGGNYVRALLPHPDGHLWVASQGTGVAIYDPQTDGFEQLRSNKDDPHSLANDGPITMALAADGSVWVGFSAGGLDRWDPATRQFKHHRHHPDDPGSLSHDTVRSVLVDRRGDLWVGTGDGLGRLRSGSSEFERIASDPSDAQSLAGQYVYSLYEAGDGGIWIGTQAQGAAMLNPDTLAFTRIPVGDEGVSHPWIDGFVEPMSGRIWVATFGGGIDVLDSQTGRALRRIRNDPAIPGTLALDRIVQPLRDRSGMIWVGSWGAGAQHHNPFNAKAFQSLRHSPSRSNGLSLSTVLSILDLPDGRIWVGTAGNGIDVLDRERGVVGGYRPNSKAAGALGDGTVRALAATTDGSLWVGTQQAGLLRYLAESDRFRPVSMSGTDRRIRRLLPSRSGRLIVGRDRGLALLDPADESLVFLTLEDGNRFDDQIWSLVEDAGGNLWVGTPNTLFSCRAGETVLRAPPAELARRTPSAVLDLHVDGNQHLWAVTPDGLSVARRWQDGWPLFEPWGRMLQDLDPTYGRQLLSDGSGRLWTPRFVFNPDTTAIEAFGRADGVDIGNVESGAKAMTRDGMLMFGGTRGLLLIDPDEYRPWRDQPKVLATSLEIDGAQHPVSLLANALRLGSDQKRFSVEFAALDYSDPELNRYAYRLEGLDSQWIDTDASRRVATYNNLWPGDYVLHVRGSGRSGAWSDSALRIPLTVLPAWWQTWWSAAFCLLAALVLAYAGLSLRTARIRKNAERLQVLVDERTTELSYAKERAEQALLELQGTQTQLVESEKMASLGQLVAGVAHEINTPIGIAVTAASHLQEVTRENGTKLAAGQLTRSDLNFWHSTMDEAMRLILGSLDRANTLITSFKRVAVDQSSEQRRCFALHQFLHEVQIALQPSFRRSTHNLSIDCATSIEVDTYPGALFQILTNLINNAVLHAFAEGQSGKMRIEAERQGQRLQLRFLDDGVGMSSEIAAQAFNPFFTTRRGSGGSGLGLHLVHNLTTQMLGGTIALRSAPGQGAEFVIDLPLTAPSK